MIVVIRGAERVVDPRSIARAGPVVVWPRRRRVAAGRRRGMNKLPKWPQVASMKSSAIQDGRPPWGGGSEFVGNSMEQPRAQGDASAVGRGNQRGTDAPPPR